MVERQTGVTDRRCGKNVQSLSSGPARGSGVSLLGWSKRGPPSMVRDSELHEAVSFAHASEIFPLLDVVQLVSQSIFYYSSFFILF